MTIYIQALIPQKQKGPSSKVDHCAITFVCAVMKENWNKTEKLNMNYFFVLDMFGWLEKSKEEDTKVFEFENNLSRENLRLPARVTFGWVKPQFLKNNLNYPPKWFFSLQINAKFGWRKLFGLMWECLWIGARFAPNWKKRHQLVQKDVAQPQLSHHNYKLSLFPFCCRYFQTSPAKCR